MADTEIITNAQVVERVMVELHAAGYPRERFRVECLTDEATGEFQVAVYERPAFTIRINEKGPTDGT